MNGARRLVWLHGAILGAFLLCAAAAAPALADLPRTYQVQRVDSPSPTDSGKFGLSLANVGDVNRDGLDDLVTGTDKHGNELGAGQVTVISGADGTVLRSYALPDVDSGGPRASGDRPSGFGNAVAKLADIGSCPGFAGQPGDLCTAAGIGDPDTIPEHLVSASGVDVAADNDDLGVVYVFDGASGALLKRLHMPPADRAEQVAAGGNDPRYGRTLISAAGLPPCDQNAGIGTCPGEDEAPEAVRIGDLDGDELPEVLVGATDYDESKATAHPESGCATQVGTEPCNGSGRVYVYSGADIAGSNPADVLDSATTIKNPLSQPDDPTPPSPFSNDEAFGILLIPIGDAGLCTGAPASPGGLCPTPPSPRDLDGVPDFVIVANGVDLFGFTDVGEALQIDGAKLSTIKDTEYPEPRIDPSWGIAQNGTVNPPLGDVDRHGFPDFYVPDIQWTGDHGSQGRGLIVSGNPAFNGSFREFPAVLVDPTPQGSEQFGLAAAGLGDLAGSPHNEIMVGAIGPHNPGTNEHVVNDVHIFSPVTETVLQTIPAPDQQGGETFGAALQPLGDLNGDGFLDFAVGAGFFDLTEGAPCPGGACLNSGRVYVFRSDNSPPPAPPAPPPPAPGAAATPAATAAPLAGRAVELTASRTRISRRSGSRRGRPVRLKGIVEAFANERTCESRQQVRIQRRRRGSFTYRTFQRRRTSRTGRFTSRRFSPRRTYFYRAFVPQTAECIGAASRPLRITVRRSIRRRPALP